MTDGESRAEGVAAQINGWTVFGDRRTELAPVPRLVGTPRGVVVPHRGLVNHNVAAAELFDLSPEDRVLQFSSLSFDIAVEELFPAWIAGAAVVLRGGDDTLEPAEFTRRIAVIDRFNDFTRGIIALRDVIYFGTFIRFFLFLNTVLVDQRKAD